MRASDGFTVMSEALRASRKINDDSSE